MFAFKTETQQRLVEQGVKDPVLSLQWLRLLLWHGFDPWPRNFYMPQVWPEKKKKIIEQRQLKFWG